MQYSPKSARFMKASDTLVSPYNNNNNNNNNFIVPIKGPRRGRELHIKQILIQCTYNNTTFLCRTESETK